GIVGIIDRFTIQADFLRFTVRNKCSYKIVLDHRRPATIHIATKIILLQIPKIDFFVFITLTGEYGTGIGINEETIVFRFITIKLRVWIRRKTLAGLVFN